MEIETASLSEHHFSSSASRIQAQSNSHQPSSPCLRRVNPLDFSDVDSVTTTTNPNYYPQSRPQQHHEDSASMVTYGTVTAPPPSSIASTTMEEQKQQLLGICEVIQVQLRGALERIGKLVRWIESSGGTAGRSRALLDEYQQKAWPVVVEADTQIKLLSRTVRRTIDACSINERRLDWLLAVHKFEVNIEQMLTTLTTTVNDDIVRVLDVRIRSAPDGMTGLHLRADTVNAVQEMQKEIRAKTFRV